MIAAALCFAAGLAASAGGYYLIRSCEVPPGDTSFSSLLSTRALKLAGGYLGLFFGLLLAFIGAPMVYLTP
ncbi:MAG: hypothetical protein NUW21_00430 [Elusimicrobia bacterium]|nr:hypothetical protein [Elusimicrobiota bacterium]